MTLSSIALLFLVPLLSSTSVAVSAEATLPSVDYSSAPPSASISLSRRRHFPLSSDSGIVIKENLLETIELTKEKYHATLVNFQKNNGGEPYPGTPKLDLSRKSSKRDGSVPLRPLSGSALWAGDIQIGGQNFRIDFDTGSSDLWVPSVNCTSEACTCNPMLDSTCVMKNKFDCTKSKTCVAYPDKTFSISYVDQSGVRGKQYNDTITVGGISASSTTFSAVDTMMTTLDDDAVDGIMGMGYQAISNLKQRPVFQNFYFKNPSKFKYNMFSFFFSDNPTGSELYLGGVNFDKAAKPVYYYPVTQKAYWEIGQGQFTTNNVATNAKDLSVIVDTGTTLIYAPNATVASIFASVPGAKYWQNGYWIFPCSSTPTVALSFGSNGPKFPMSLDSLNLGRTARNSPNCVASIVGQSIAGNSVLLGDAFLKNVVSVYALNQDKVGFAYLAGQNTTPAAAVSTATTTSSTAIPTSTSSIISTPTFTTTTQAPPTTTGQSAGIGRGSRSTATGNAAASAQSASVGRGPRVVTPVAVAQQFSPSTSSITLALARGTSAPHALPAVPRRRMKKH